MVKNGSTSHQGPRDAGAEPEDAASAMSTDANPGRMDISEDLRYLLYAAQERSNRLCELVRSTVLREIRGVMTGTVEVEVESADAAAMRELEVGIETELAKGSLQASAMTVGAPEDLSAFDRCCAKTIGDVAQRMQAMDVEPVRDERVRDIVRRTAQAFGDLSGSFHLRMFEDDAVNTRLEQVFETGDPGEPLTALTAIRAKEEIREPSLRFDASPSDVWERAVEAHTRSAHAATETEREEKKEEVIPFRWSWTDDELFLDRPIPLLRNVDFEAALEILQKEIRDGMVQWKQEFNSMLGPAAYFTAGSQSQIIPNKTAVDAVEQNFNINVAFYIQEMKDDLLDQRTFRDADIMQLIEDFQRGAEGNFREWQLPPPTFLRYAFEQFVAVIHQGEPFIPPLIHESHVSKGESLYYQPNEKNAYQAQQGIQGLLIGDLWRGVTIETAVQEALSAIYDKEHSVRSNQKWATKQAVRSLTSQLSHLAKQPPEILQLTNTQAYVQFLKTWLEKALHIIAEFRDDELPDRLLSTLRNAVSLHICRNFRTAALIVPPQWKMDIGGTEYLNELEHFYPQPPEDTAQREAALRYRREIAEAMPQLRLCGPVRTLTLNEHDRLFREQRWAERFAEAHVLDFVRTQTIKQERNRKRPGWDEAAFQRQIEEQKKALYAEQLQEQQDNTASLSKKVHETGPVNIALIEVPVGPEGYDVIADREYLAAFAAYNAALLEAAQPFVVPNVAYEDEAPLAFVLDPTASYATGRAAGNTWVGRLQDAHNEWNGYLGETADNPTTLQLCFANRNVRDKMRGMFASVRRQLKEAFSDDRPRIADYTEFQRYTQKALQIAQRAIASECASLPLQDRLRVQETMRYIVETAFAQEYLGFLGIIPALRAPDPRAYETDPILALLREEPAAIEREEGEAQTTEEAVKFPFSAYRAVTLDVFQQEAEVFIEQYIQRNVEILYERAREEGHPVVMEQGVEKARVWARENATEIVEGLLSSIRAGSVSLVALEALLSADTLEDAPMTLSPKQRRIVSPRQQAYKAGIGEFFSRLRSRCEPQSYPFLANAAISDTRVNYVIYANQDFGKDHFVSTWNASVENIRQTFMKRAADDWVGKNVQLVRDAGKQVFREVHNRVVGLCEKTSFPLMKFNTCYDFFLAVDAETSAAIRDASFTLTGDAEQYVKVNIQSELRPAIAYMFLHCQAQYPRLQAANPDEYGGNVFTELLTRPPQFSRPVPDSASGSASSANREKLPLLSPSFLSTWWHHTWEDFLGRCSFADAGSGFRGDRKELAQQLRPVERRVTAVLGRVESEKSLETRGRFEALLATLRQYLAGDASFPERVEVGRAAFPVPREEVRRYFWDRIEELREELRGEVEEHASDATQESALPEKEENGTTTERVQESSPEISAEAWEQMIREEMEAAGQKKDASDKMQRLAIGLSGKLPFALRAFRFMKIADPVRFPIRTRAELDVALRELREFFSHAYQSGTVNLLFRGTAKLSQQLADRAFSRIQNRAIRFLNTSGAQAAPRKSSKSADTTRVTADHEPTTGLELADVSEDSPLSGSPAADAERLSDLLTVYDVTQEQMAERLASAIADHVAHAATEALTAQGQQRTDVNSEQVAESLRACVAQATHTAESLLSAARTKSLTPQELAAIAGKAFDAALAEMQAPAEAAETMRTVLTEHREALQQASSAEDLVERVMEGGGSGARGFEERVHLVRQAQEQERSKAHHRRIGNIEEQNARKTRQLEALLSQLTQKAREAPTEPERQSAAAEAEKLHSFLQTIISMYTDPSSPPPPQE